jgi:hypothetical protein
MKIALCFIINYDHILNKEHIWREWIKYNQDIINVYFYYKDFNKIKSSWIKKHGIPTNYIYPTTYYHVIPAYLSLMNYAMTHDRDNMWFCFLTDSCCPIISPIRFRTLFTIHYKKSIFSWKQAWWNPYYHKRANLLKLPKNLWLANDAWFTLTRNHVIQIIKKHSSNHQHIIKTICDGGLANETLFSVILYLNNLLDDNTIIKQPTHIIDWNRLSSPTSPHVFKEGNDKDKHFITNELNKNEYSMFIRKIDINFPDDVLNFYIYKFNEKKDKILERNYIFYKYLQMSYLLFFMAGIFIFSIYFHNLNR